MAGQIGESVVDDRPAPARGGGLAGKTAKGVVWLLLQSLGSKFVMILGQIVLAWLLQRGDFGLVGLAYTVTTFTGLITEPGIRTILIHRQSSFDRWATPAFWLAIFTGLLGTVTLLAIAPIAARIYGEPRLIEMLIVLAIATPFGSLAVVPEAKLAAQLRFRYLAKLSFLLIVLEVILSIVFAASGFGALSFVLPRPISAAVRSALAWHAARPRIQRHPRLRRCRYLIGDTTTLFVSNVFMIVIMQGDYVVLGIFHDKEEVGLYFLAFSLSLQSLKLFDRNLATVLFPALTHLSSDIRLQTRSLLRGAKIIATIGMPLCFLQAALADSVVRAFLDAGKWGGTIPLIQVLSIGMAFRTLGGPAGSLMTAQGRFLMRLVVNIAFGVIFLIAVGIAAATGGAFQVAVAAAAVFALLGPARLYVSIRAGDGGWREVFDTFFLPTIVGVSAGAAAYGVSLGFDGGRVIQVVRICVSFLVWAIVAFAMTRMLLPDVVAEIRMRVVAIRPQRRL